MKRLCPYCDKVNDTDAVPIIENITIKGESYQIPNEIFKCRVCDGEFEDDFSDKDPLREAYRQYRQKHNMIQPEEIMSFRARYGLSQSELSKLLGWGGATLSRYENGALQDEAHDNVLQFIKSPENLLHLVQKKGCVLKEERKKELLDKVKGELNTGAQITAAIEKRFLSFEPSYLNGFRKFDIEKLIEMILSFCENGIFKTKLNKLLFYADFKNFKEFGISITGARYAHLPHGPSLDEYDYFFALLHHTERAIEVREIAFADGKSGEEYVSARRPNLEIFKSFELETIKLVQDYFKDFTATAIRDFSHSEKGYVGTRDGELISYEYAGDLRI